MLDTLRPRCGLECERSDVNAFDRVAVDLHSDAARTGSDILFFASMGMPLVANAIDVAISSPHDGWGGYAVDTVVFLETLGVNFYVQNLTAFTVRRPRPCRQRCPPRPSQSAAPCR